MINIGGSVGSRGLSGALPHATTVALLLAAALLSPYPTSRNAVVAVGTAATPQGWPPVVPQPTAGAVGRESATVGRCGDGAGTWLGMRWKSELRWRLNARTIPTYLGTAGEVRAAARHAATTIDIGRNDCGLAEKLDARQRFIGDSARRASVNLDGSCGNRDGQNVVSFGPLAPGLLAVTCIWWYGAKGGGRSVEADILVDDAGGLFFLSTPANCGGRWDLESTLTHEFGHAFGLGHVSYGQHGSLTMSDGLPDCSTAHRSLGLGDYRTLAAHY